VVYVDNPQVEMRADVLQDALAGRSSSVSPSQALALISQLDLPESDQQRILQAAVENSELTPQVRAAAVRSYSRGSGDAAVPVLLDVLETAEPRVIAAAATALGQVGTPEHLPALDAVRTRVDDNLALERSAFAAKLIAHRFRISERDLEEPVIETYPDPVGTGASSFVGVVPGPQRRLGALTAARLELPGLDAAESDVVEIQCGPRLLEVIVAREFLQPGTGNDVMQSPALPAVVVSQDPEHGTFDLSLLVLSRPVSGNRLNLQLARPSGEPIYLGEGTVSDGTLAIDLRSVQAPGVVPIAARVWVTATHFEISGFSDRRTTIPANSPEPIDADSL